MADRPDDVTEEVSSSQDSQPIPTVHEVGEGSSQAEEAFRMQLVNDVTLFKHLMENPREFLQSPLMALQGQKHPSLTGHNEAQFQVPILSQMGKEHSHAKESCEAPKENLSVHKQVARTPVLQAIADQPTTLKRPNAGSNGQEIMFQDMHQVLPPSTPHSGYLAANQKYPAIALVVRETGGLRNTVKEVLNDLKSNQSASVIGSNADETLHVQLEDMTSLDKVRSDQSASVLESDAAETLLHRMDNESWNSLDELKIDGLASVNESDAADTLLDCMDTEDIKSPETLESAQSASVLEHDAPEGDGLNKGYNSNLADIISEKGSQNASDQDFLGFLEQVTSKEDAAKKTGPLISLLQQATSGSSRRVHLSPWKGIENDLSWESTLRSIMPSSINKNQEPISDNSLCSTLSTCPEAGTNFSSTRSSLLKMFTEIEENASGNCKTQYGVKLVAKIRASVLLKFTSASLIAELKGISKVFSQLQSKVDRVQVKNVPIHAIVYFKTKKGMMDALKLKTLVIRGEILSLESITGAVVEEKSSQDPDTAILCSKTSTSERVQAPCLPAEENSSSDFSVEATDLCNRSHDMWSFDFLQNTIMIECFPKELSKKHLYEFFGVFGILQMFYNNESIFVKFQNECDKDKALKVHKFVLDQYCFRINADVPPDELIVRLVSNGKAGADQKKAMKAFSKYGAVSYIEYNKIGLLTAHYENSEKKRLKEILAG
ncbi:hypothetical protein L7F22_015863 [Adiantum nelumboides]|nr:hypothetical protein [Adiantum nelumboides]